MPDEVQMDPSAGWKAAIVDGLSRDPKYRRRLQTLVKEWQPSISIPEIDVPRELEETTVKPLRESLDKTTEELAALRAERAIERERAAAIKASGLSDQDWADVEKVMTDSKIADPSAAAELHALRRSAARPRTTFGSTWDMPGGADAAPKDFWKDPRGTARRVADKVIAEFRNGR